MHILRARVTKYGFVRLNLLIVSDIIVYYYHVELMLARR